ncbi:MAG: hypothetical protein ACHRHE_12515 [Tepidisphaerales bacterium]
MIPNELQTIRQLLHDAMLKTLAWDAEIGQLRIVYDCLRRNIDGSDLSDRAVELVLTTVGPICVGYDDFGCEVRPSCFEPAGRIVAGDLAAWAYRQQHADLAIDSTGDIAEVLESAKIDWLCGTANDLAKATHILTLAFNQWTDFGLPCIGVHVLVGFEGLDTRTDGLPLTIEEWTDQFDAWWRAWQERWATKTDDREESTECIVEDTIIPAGEDEKPDLDYCPPAEPIFALEPTDAPETLMVPLRDWFEGHHDRAWHQMAAAFPYSHETIDERATKIREAHLTHQFGRWGYPRVVDQWWIEGSRGAVVLRGVEHIMSTEGDPAENCEVVWTFDLRRRNGRWIIRSYSEGLAKFHAAPRISTKPEPWRERWASGAIR